jgi:hypothetical protein
MTTKQHLALHDKQIAAKRNLVQGGRQLVRAMLDSQRRTEKNLASLIAALGRSGIGKH